MNELISFSNITSNGEPFDFILNDKIFKNKENGFFIELGAYDGILQSNTAFFEKYKNWKGILIEPSRDRYIECVNNRKNSKCFNYACSSSIKDKLLIDEENGLMSKVVKNDGSYTPYVTTLEIILNSCNVTCNIDFLSLDVEGYEYEVLLGLNLNKYRPNYILVELWTNNEDITKKFLTKNNYICLENFSKYNIIDNQHWGVNGNFHNDFLFVDKNL